MNIVWTDNADKDLAEIVNYLFDTGQLDDVIEYTAKRIFETTDKLLVFSNIGRVGTLKTLKSLSCPICLTLSFTKLTKASKY